MDTFKIDLHTHSIISYDGGINASQYTKLIESGVLDYIAITDHNETQFARIMQQQLGERIIIGEEISTIDGEIIGLYLTETIPAGMSAVEAIGAIKAQNGLVYIPHPFEIFRKGLQKKVLEQIAHDIDIIEVFNGRGRWRNKNKLAEAFSYQKQIIPAASSDAHCILGVGKTFSTITQKPSEKTLTKLMHEGILQKEFAPLISLLCPAINKVKNKVVV